MPPSLRRAFHIAATSFVSVSVCSLFAACGSGGVPPGASPGKTDDVYIVGTVYDLQDQPSIRLWKNGVVQPLAVSGSLSSGYAAAVKNGNVYAAGDVFTGNQDIATYWVNGQEHLLSDGSQRTHASGIAVSESGDVYVSGFVTVLRPDNLMEGHPAVWKNGVLTDLSHLNVTGQANQVYVNGSDVYVAGYLYLTKSTATGTYTAPNATIWKNGVAISLVSYAGFSIAEDVTVHNGSVYVAGTAADDTTSFSDKASVWKDGVMTHLTTQTSTSATGIAFDGETMHVSGGTGELPNEAFHWTNGSLKVLQASSAISRRVAVGSKGVYLVGGILDSGVYWLNDYPLPVSTQKSSDAYAIAVDSR